MFWVDKYKKITRKFLYHSSKEYEKKKNKAGAGVAFRKGERRIGTKRREYLIIKKIRNKKASLKFRNR